MGWFVLWHLFTIQTVIWRYYSSRQRWLKKQVPQSAYLSTLYLESLTAHLTWGAIHRSQFCFGAASHWTRVSLWWSSIRPKPMWFIFLVCQERNAIPHRRTRGLGATMRGGKKMVPFCWKLEARDWDILGPAEKQMAVITGNWEKIKCVAWGEAAMCPHLHTAWILECAGGFHMR